MAEVLVDTQGPPATPASGKAFLYPESLTKKWQSKNDTGEVDTLAGLFNASTANQSGFAADTYLVGSSILIPASQVKAKTIYRLKFDMTKTAAGIATPILTIRIGTLGAVGDAARLVFTFAAGTAAIDTGVFEVRVHFRNIGASAVAVGVAQLNHHLAATGLSSTGASGNSIILVTSSAFDSTVANSIMGASFNGGASFAGTNTIVQTEVGNI